MKNKDEMLFANDIPTASTHGKMVAKLVCETANLKKRINDLLKENTEWKLENNRLNNIINELEKWLEDNLGNCRTNQNYTSNQIYNLKEDIYYRCLDKLKTLKENNKDV